MDLDRALSGPARQSGTTLIKQKMLHHYNRYLCVGLVEVSRDAGMHQHEQKCEQSAWTNAWAWPLKLETPYNGQSLASDASSAGCSSTGWSRAHRAGRLTFHGALAALADPDAFAAHLAPMRRALIPSALASAVRAMAQPSLLLSTITGTRASLESNTRSHEQ